MTQGRILALDVGKKRIGLALSDEMRITGQPYGCIEVQSNDQVLGELAAVVEKENVSMIVLGMPKRLDGSSGEMAQEVKALAGRLRERFSFSVKLWDERFSTHAAQRVLLQGDVSRKKRKKVIDQTAAAWILQGFLDSGRAS
ncbi:MAG: Holliday junction resolvase RuvX [Candidatus Omnitrophica bacterium]|nr:Holliday junction resolvase RuvX [Candidatus Omnitrophota bacterium]